MRKDKLTRNDIGLYVQTLLRCRVEENVEIITCENYYPVRGGGWHIIYKGVKIFHASFPFWEKDDLELLAAFSPPQRAFMVSGIADPIGTVFFLLSLWWERTHPQWQDDTHYFKEEYAFLAHFNLLQIPVADILLDDICKRMGFHKRPFYSTPKLLMTHDIDTVYPYSMPVRILAQDLIRKRKLKQFMRRAWEICSGKNYCDPAALALKEKKQGVPSISLVLNTPQRGRYRGSGYLLSRHANYSKFIQAHNNDDYIAFGLHYSATYLEDGSLGNDEELETLLGKKVVCGRSHWLVMDAIESYKLFQKQGIDFDFTGGFNYTTGYKFGTSLPFRPFDFEKRRPFSFYEYPTTLMDSGLRKQCQESLQKERQMWQHYSDTIMQTGGLLTVLWHPRAYDDWEARETQMYDAIDDMRAKKFLFLTLTELEELSNEENAIWHNAYIQSLEKI